MTSCKSEVTKVTIHCDDAADSPRNEDPIGTIVAFHRRYSLGEKHNFSNTDEFLDSLIEEKDEVRYCEAGSAYDEPCRSADEIWESEIEMLVEETDRNRKRSIHKAIIGYLSDTFIIMPLFMFEHGDISLGTTPYSCPWDSG